MSNQLTRRRLAFAAAASLFLSLGGCSVAITSSQDAQSADIAQLTRQADAWDKAIVRKDLAAIETNMADDFRQIDGDADIETKASFVAGLVSPKLTINPYTVEDFEVRLYGDVALLSGRTHMTGSYDGKTFASHYRYIDVYARRNRVRKIVSVQITKKPK
ncbi:MAG: nuclear transport factor 2 family protein [Pseudomonadota bacterium]